MGYEPLEMDGAMINDPHGLASGFIKEWESDTAYVTAYTSGSTGQPKPVRLSKADMEISARATCEFFNLTSSSHLLLPLSTDYIAGKMMVVRALLFNSTLTALKPATDPFRNQQLPAEVALVAIVPSQIPALIEASSRCKFTNIIIGGAPVLPDQLQQLKDAGLNGWITYGMTETCSHVALRHISHPLYTALPGVTFSVDSRNCLAIKHDTMSFGLLQTNDVVELLSPTRFVWLGRQDNVINSGGIKIHPEIDEAILAPYIDVNFYIAARPDAKWGELPVLMLEGTDNGRTNQYLAAAASRLPKYHNPKSAMWTPQFQRTNSGKIKRNKAPWQ